MKQLLVEATLAKVCEEAYQELLQENPEVIHPVYIVGSEVPPRWSTRRNAGMQVTKPRRLQEYCSYI